MQNRLNKIKVVHVISGLNAGGTEMMLYKLLSQMSESKFENTVISLTDSENGEVGKKIKELGLPLYTLSMRAGSINPKGFIKLLILLYRLKADVLQSWLYHSDLLCTFAFFLSPVKKLCWNIRCSYVDFKKYSKLTELTVRALSKLSFIPDVVVVNSEEGRKHHSTIGFHPKKWKYIPNGFNTNKFQPSSIAKSKLIQELKLVDSDFLIGMVARFDPLKDHENFIEAARHLSLKNQNVHYVLIGRGLNDKNSNLVAQIKKARLEDKFHLLGERKDVAELVAGLDLFSLSSKAEGFPNVIGEAMACGIPCVVTNAGDSANIVGETGITVPISNAKALAEAWEKFTQMSPDELKQKGALARKRILEKFDLPAIANEYEELYSELLADNSAPSLTPLASN